MAPYLQTTGEGTQTTNAAPSMSSGDEFDHGNLRICARTVRFQRLLADCGQEVIYRRLLALNRDCLVAGRDGRGLGREGGCVQAHGSPGHMRPFEFKGGTRRIGKLVR